MATTTKVGSRRVNYPMENFLR